MIDEVAHTLELSPLALVTMSLMCLICSFMVGQLQDSIPGMIFSYIGIFAAGFAGNTLFRKYEFHPLGNKDLDAVVSTTAGLIAGVVLYTLFKLAMTVLYGTARSIPQTNEDAVRSISNG